VRKGHLTSIESSLSALRTLQSTNSNKNGSASFPNRLFCEKAKKDLTKKGENS
jgi:hypothetical protein